MVPYSRVGKEISSVLEKRHFLQEVKEEVKEGKKVLALRLQYEKRKPVFTNALIISKPSLRVYERAKSILKRKKRGHGVAVLSTSKGILTGEEAQKKGVGGELLFEIW
ncbi:MAG: 30S ribosomal protein S8 [Candidatus Levybacteria bacterium]|nr:30S ribosomal protein S8 [Candidatus Levybacteria bacterium]